MPDEIWAGSNDAYHQLTDVIGNPDYDWPFALDAMRGGYAGLIELAVLIPEPGTVVLAATVGMGLLVCGAFGRRLG